MIRQAAFLAVALCLTSTHADAQATYTLKENADVHQSAATSSPLIGRAARGRVLELTRDVGDWAEIVWEGSSNHAGYIRVRLGAVPLAAFRDLPTIRPAASPSAAVAATAAANPPNADAGTTPSARPAPSGRVAKARDPLAFELPPHTTGFGIRMDPRFRDFGGAARLWSSSRLGAQIEVQRSTMTSEVAPGRLTNWQFAPAALYALPDVVNSSIWVRPYIGTGLDLLRASYSSITPGTSATDTAFGTKVFGGAEMTVAGAPQVTLSTDVGYHWLESSFSGFDLSGVRFTIAAHWYMK